jgi:hypothetical protein
LGRIGLRSFSSARVAARAYKYPLQAASRGIDSSLPRGPEFIRGLGGAGQNLDRLGFDCSPGIVINAPETGGLSRPPVAAYQSEMDKGDFPAIPWQANGHFQLLGLN